MKIDWEKTLLIVVKNAIFSVSVITFGLIDSQENNDMKHVVRNIHDAICKKLPTPLLPYSPNKP